MEYEIEKEILKILEKHPEGVTIVDIARELNVHRNTVSKYIYGLVRADVVTQRRIGVASLCFLKKHVEHVEKRKRLQKGKISLLSLFLVSVVVLLLFSSLDLGKALGNFTEADEAAIQETLVVEVPEEVAAEKIEEYVVKNESVSQEEVSVTQDNVSEEVLGNESIVEEPLNISSEKIAEDVSNITILNESLPEPVLSEPEAVPITTELPTMPILSTVLDVPSKVTRGETIEIKANVENVGTSTARNVDISWELPNEFEIVSGNLEEGCGDIEPENSYVSTISVIPTLSTELGLNEIKVLVTYDR